MQYQIIQGNCLETLKTIESESIQCCVTSPPYWGLRDYGTAEWQGGDVNCSHKRDSKQSVLCKTGQKNLEGAIGDGIYKTKCSRCGAIRKDKQLGLEETPQEYVANMVKVFSEVKRVLAKDGTLWLNLGDSYAGSGKGPSGNLKDNGERHLEHITKPYKDNNLKPKDLVGIPWRVAFALQADGWYLRQDIIWHKPNPMPESVTDRCTKAHEYVFLLSKSGKYYYDNDAIKEKAKTEPKPRNKNAEGYVADYPTGERFSEGQRVYGEDGMTNKRSVWTIPIKPYAEAHFATYPQKLIRPCIKAGTKVGDTVLDPFGGSGTTAEVANELGRKAILCELNPKYIDIANNRLSKTQFDLFPES